MKTRIVTTKDTSSSKYYSRIETSHLGIWWVRHEFISMTRFSGTTPAEAEHKARARLHEYRKAKEFGVLITYV